MIGRAACFAFLFTLLGGCAGMRQPSLANNESSAQQRASAQRFDPYPEVGPGPEIVAGRPRDYDRALPETSRARWNRPRFFQPR